MNTNQTKLWTKDFILLWISNFLMAVGFYFLLPTMPVFAVKALHADKSQVGYIIGVYTFSALAIRPIAGYALDAMGRKKVYLWALGIFALLMASYNFASTMVLLLLFRLIHGFSWGITTTGGSTIVADLLPPQRRGEGVGYFGLSMTIAMALGPAIGLGLMGNGQYSKLFLAAMLLAASSFLLALFIKYPQVPAVKKTLSWDSFIENKVIPVSVVMFFTTMVYGGIVSFITLYSSEIGIKNGGLFFLTYAVAVSLVRPISGKLLDRHGPSLVVTAGFLYLIAGFPLLAISKGVLGFMAAAITIGAGYGMVWPTLQTMIINMVPPQRRGVANSTYFSALDLGIGIGSIVLGWMADWTSLETMYLVSSAILLLPLAYFFLYAAKDYQTKMAEVSSHD